MKLKAPFPFLSQLNRASSNGIVFNASANVSFPLLSVESMSLKIIRSNCLVLKQHDLCLSQRSSLPRDLKICLNVMLIWASDHLMSTEWHNQNNIILLSLEKILRKIRYRYFDQTHCGLLGDWDFICNCINSLRVILQLQGNEKPHHAFLTLRFFCYKCLLSTIYCARHGP